jgi:hypothetical protein
VPSVAEKFLVLGQKFSVAKTKSVLICAICGSIPKVKKCKKSAQNTLKTCSFLAKSSKKTFIFDKKVQKNAHFYPHFYAKNQ